ncbi:hypothetical protein KH5_20910 [Urechidicola sp. KH5]
MFEDQEHSNPSILGMLFSPMILFLTTTFIRPFKIGILLFTCIITIAQVFVFWQGVVSACRTYLVKEMEASIAQVKNNDQYNGDIKKVQNSRRVMIYLSGMPK